MTEQTERAEALRNDDTDRVFIQANGYFLGVTPEGKLVIAFDTSGQDQWGIFLDHAAAVDFLDRFTAEMQAMGFLT